MFRKLAMILATAAVGSSPFAISKIFNAGQEQSSSLPAIAIDAEANKEKISRLLNEAVAMAKNGHGNEATHKAVLCGLGSLGYESGSQFINSFLSSKAISADLSFEVQQQIENAKHVLQVDAAMLQQDVARWCGS